MTGIEYTDDVSCICVFYDISVLSHELLRLRESYLLTESHVIDRHVLLVLTGADPHEGHTVSVVGIHVSLDLEYEAGEHLVCRFYCRDLVRYVMRLGHGSDLKEVLKECLHTEVSDGRSEEYGS